MVVRRCGPEGCDGGEPRLPDPVVAGEAVALVGAEARKSEVDGAARGVGVREVGHDEGFVLHGRMYRIVERGHPVPGCADLHRVDEHAGGQDGGHLEGDVVAVGEPVLPRRRAEVFEGIAELVEERLAEERGIFVGSLLDAGDQQAARGSLAGKMVEPVRCAGPPCEQFVGSLDEAGLELGGRHPCGEPRGRLLSRPLLEVGRKQQLALLCLAGAGDEAVEGVVETEDRGLVAGLKCATHRLEPLRNRGAPVAAEEAAGGGGWFDPEPGVDNDAEHPFGADEELCCVELTLGGVAKLPLAINKAEADHHVFDFAEAGGVLAGGAGGEVAADGAAADGGGEVAERKAVALEFMLEALPDPACTDADESVGSAR